MEDLAVLGIVQSCWQDAPFDSTATLHFNLGAGHTLVGAQSKETYAGSQQEAFPPRNPQLPLQSASP